MKRMMSGGEWGTLSKKSRFFLLVQSFKPLSKSAESKKNRDTDR